MEQDRTGQDRTGQDRTGQDRTGQDRTGQDRTGQDRTENISIVISNNDLCWWNHGATYFSYTYVKLQVVYRHIY